MQLEFPETMLSGTDEIVIPSLYKSKISVHILTTGFFKLFQKASSPRSLAKNLHIGYRTAPNRNDRELTLDIPATFIKNLTHFPQSPFYHCKFCYWQFYHC